MFDTHRLSGERRDVPVLYLDLDGTVRHGPDELGRFVNDPSDVVIYPEAVTMMRRWRKAGGRIVAITNQGGVALGHVTEEAVRAALVETYVATGGLFDHLMACAHHPGAIDPARARCWCRKPKPGMIIMAATMLPVRSPLYLVRPGGHAGDHRGDHAGRRGRPPVRHRLDVHLVGPPRPRPEAGGRTVSGYLRSARRRYRLTCSDCRSSLAVILGLTPAQRCPATHLVKYRHSGLVVRVCAEHARKRTEGSGRNHRLIKAGAGPALSAFLEWATRVDAYRFRKQLEE